LAQEPMSFSGFGSLALGSSALETEEDEEEQSRNVDREGSADLDSPAAKKKDEEPVRVLSSPAVFPGHPRRTASAQPGASSFAHPADLAAQLNAHPTLAALRSPGFMNGLNALQPMTPMARMSPQVVKSPPLLVNSSCSGYFVEPMKWMESFLENGELAGKIVCPNKKCGAKLGNYDWAGVCCSCKEWVTPGFCIHRSKVDEVV